MASREKALQKKAEKFELKKLQAIQVTKERVSALDTLLEDIYATRRPKPTDYIVREDLIRVFNEIAKEIYDKSKDIPVVVEFGSFVMDLFSTTSDLDLSVNFSTSADFPRKEKIQTLRKFATKLYALQSMGHVYGVHPITTAKVPILKCVDRGTGVECDISVENRDGISKSLIIRIISSIDERFKKLSFLLKVWAKAHNINSSKDKTLNSLSIILLVTFHLQTRNPPILPPFSAIFEDGNDPVAVEKSMPNFVNYGIRNRESLAELFITLLLKLSSVEKLWAKGLCASTCTASWTSKTWDSKVAPISVEDFTDTSQNVARAVGVAQVKQIYKCIDISIGNITAFMTGQIGLQLKDLLFGAADGTALSIPRDIPNVNPVVPFNCISPQATQTRGGIVTGKRKKKPMWSGSSLKNRKFRKGNRRGIQVEKREQLHQAILVETSFPKKMRTDEGWRGMPYGRHAAAQAEGQFEATSSQQWNRGWGDMRARGWEQGDPFASGGGWEETHKPRGSGWGLSQQTWGATPPHGGWEVTHKPTRSDWRLSPQNIWGATPPHGGWKETHKPTRSDWGLTQERRWGAVPACGGWDGTHETGGSVRGGMRPDDGREGGRNQQHGSGGWPNVGVWVQTSDHRGYRTRF